MEREAYAEIYREFLPAVLRLLRGGFRYQSGESVGFMRIQSAFDAEELCQEVFSEFFQQCERGNFDASRPIKPYLFRIAANRAARKMGKASREVLVSDELPVEPSPPPSTEAEERARLLAEFRRTLSDEENRLVDLHFVEGASQRETGEALGQSRDQIYRSIQKIRKRAKAFFSERGWFHAA